MASAEIDIRTLKNAIVSVLDHLVDDLSIHKLPVNEAEDYYWNCPKTELYNVEKEPTKLDIGRLTDDMDFVKRIRRGQSADASFNLVHVAPLLRYIAEKVGQ